MNKDIDNMTLDQLKLHISKLENKIDELTKGRNYNKRVYLEGSNKSARLFYKNKKLE